MIRYEAMIRPEETIRIIHEEWREGLPFQVCMYILKFLGTAFPVPYADHHNIDTWLRYRYCSHCGEPIRRVIYSRIRTWLTEVHTNQERTSIHPSCKRYLGSLRRVVSPAIPCKRAHPPILSSLYMVPYYAMRMFGLQHALCTNSISLMGNKMLLHDIEEHTQSEDEDSDTESEYEYYDPLDGIFFEPPTERISIMPNGSPRPYYIVYSKQSPEVFRFSSSPSSSSGSVTVTKRFNTMLFSALHNMCIWTTSGFERMMREKLGHEFELPPTTFGFYADPMPLSRMPDAWVRSVSRMIFHKAPDMYTTLDVPHELMIPVPLCAHPNTIYENVIRSRRLRDIFMTLRVPHNMFPLWYECSIKRGQ